MSESFGGEALVLSPPLDTSYRVRRVPERSGRARPGLGLLRVSRCGPFRLDLRQRRSLVSGEPLRSLWLSVSAISADFLETRAASCGLLLERAGKASRDFDLASRCHWLMRYPADSLSGLLSGPMLGWGDLDLTLLALSPMGCPSVDLRVASALTVYGSRESTVGLRVLDVLDDLADAGGVLGPELALSGTVMVPSAAFVPLAAPDEAALVGASGFLTDPVEPVAV